MIFIKSLKNTLVFLIHLFTPKKMFLWIMSPDGTTSLGYWCINTAIAWWHPWPWSAWVQSLQSAGKPETEKAKQGLIFTNHCSEAVLLNSTGCGSVSKWVWPFAVWGIFDFHWMALQLCLWDYMDSCLKPHKQANSNDKVKAPMSLILASRKADRKPNGRQSFIMHPRLSFDSSQPIFTLSKRDSCRAVPAS